MTRWHKPGWRTVFGFLLSLAFVPFVLTQIDLTQLWLLFQSVHYPFLLLAIGPLLLAHLLRAWRWQYLLAPLKQVSFFSPLSALSIGLMANMLLPAHAGEMIRAYVLGRREQVGRLACLATIVAERLADLVSLLLLLVVLLLTMPHSAEHAALATWLRLSGYSLGALSVLLCGGLWFLATYTTRVIRWLDTALAGLPTAWRYRPSTALASFAPGLHIFRNGWQVLLILILSSLQWVLLACNNGLILHAMGLPLPIHAVFIVVVCEVLGTLIPSAPGFIGTYHAVVITGLSMFGVSQEHAVSAAVLIHAMFFFPYILLGCVFLWRESLSLRQLRQMQPPGESA